MEGHLKWTFSNSTQPPFNCKGLALSLSTISDFSWITNIKDIMKRKHSWNIIQKKWLNTSSNWNMDFISTKLWIVSLYTLPRKLSGRESWKRSPFTMTYDKDFLVIIKIMKISKSSLIQQNPKQGIRVLPSPQQSYFPAWSHLNTRP